MNETLPKGWVETDFSTINFHKSKNIDPRNHPEIEYELYSVPSFPSGKPEILKGKEIGSSKQVVEPGDVLVCKINPRINRVWQVSNNSGRPQIASSEWIVFRSNYLLSDYLRYQFTENKFREMICTDLTGVGGSLTRAQPKRVATFPVLIAPPSEQKRIVEKLYCLLTKVDACKARLDKVPEILKRFRQSVLANAVSGKLTENWRKEKAYHEIKVLEPFIHYLKGPASWKKDTLFNVCKFVGGSQPPKANFIYEKQPDTIRLIQIRDYKSDDKKVYIQKKLAKRFCSKTDVMIGRYGPPIFQILRGLEGAYNVALMKAVPEPDKLDNEFLYYYLQNPNLFRYVEAGSDRTAGQSGINKKLLDKYPIFVPPMDEQKEIVFRVEFLLSAANQLEEKVEIAKTKVTRLTESILSKAFRGELIKQDFNDEPATVLMEHICAEREALAANKKKGGQTSQKKSGRGKRTKPQEADAEAEPEPAARESVITGVDKEKDSEFVSGKQADYQIEKRFYKPVILQAFRKAIFRQISLDEYTLLRLVGRRLGIQRLSKSIRKELESYIRITIRRKIIARNGDGYIPKTPTINHYDNEYLIKVLCSVIKKGYEYDREHVVAVAAEYLGFENVSLAFSEKLKTVFRLALRRGELYRNGGYLGKN